jgi:prepilin-type N-terminal cleavage/methylation domain-containing protein
MKTKSIRSSQGFTIIELMIALSVLSVLILMSTVIMMRIGSLYTKGVNAANLQNANRNAVGDITSSLQFSGVTPINCGSFCSGGGPYRAFCLGNVRYSYLPGKTLGTDGSTGINTPHVLWRDTLSVAADSSTCQPLNLALPIPTDGISNHDGDELVPAHVRISRFDVTQSGTDTFTVTLWMAYGDDDTVINSPLSCRGDNGNSAYCGTSKITTTVIRRVQ